MIVRWLDDDLSRAIVFRRSFPIFGTMLRAEVRRDWPRWLYQPSGDPVGASLDRALDAARARELTRRERAAARARNWRPVAPPALPPARAVKMAQPPEHACPVNTTRTHR